MPTELSTELLSLLAARHRRAQADRDELRQRGLEIVIAACVRDVSVARRGSSSSVPIDTSVLSEADVTSAPARPRSPVTSEPQAQEEIPLPPEPDDAEGTSDWPAPDEPSTLEDDLVELDGALHEAEEEPATPDGTAPRPVEAPRPAPPVSPEPAVEDVRGAWKPPPNG